MLQASLLNLPSVPPHDRLRVRSVAAALAVQLLILAALLVLPLFWPARLPIVQALAAAPPQLVPPHINVQLIQPKPRPFAASLQAARAPAAATERVETVRQGGMLTRMPSHSAGETAPAILLGGGMSDAFSFANGPGSATGARNAAAVAVRVTPAAGKDPGTLRISKGVTEGHLLTPMRPVYPPIAISTHTSGTVMISATIDRDGRITHLEVTSGPELLRRAAIEAVSQARYGPFLLNGEPTEVVTTISVNFHMGDS